MAGRDKRLRDSVPPSLANENVYLFSGLGADARAFQLLDIGDVAVHHIQWEQPARGESLAAYARRLSVQITQPHPTFIGLSFGGIVAGEVSKIMSARRLILLASVKSASELPPYYRWAGAVGLHKILPSRLLVTPNPFADWLFGALEPADRQLLSHILRDTDPVFLRWAINAVVRWRGATVHPDLHHIHGTADRILPYKYVDATRAVKGGGHLLTVTNAKEVSAILRRLLSQS